MFKDLPIWAQNKIIELEAENLSLKRQLFKAQQCTEDIVCGIDFNFSQHEPANYNEANNG